MRSMETALVDTAFSLVPYQATTALTTGARPKRAGSGNPIAAPYQVYATGDGEIMLAAPNQRLWERVPEILGAPELLADERYRTVTDRSSNNELGYVPLAETACELMFQVIADRAEKAAMILTTNLPFSEWSQVIPNPRLCKALIDRLTDRAHILTTGTDSYRFRRTTAQRKAGKA